MPAASSSSTWSTRAPAAAISCCSTSALSAARWHRRAAEWAGLTDFAAAAHHWGRVRALLRDLPDDRDSDLLGILACTQLLNVSWRLGLGLDEARALLQEGQARTSASADRRAHLRLSSTSPTKSVIRSPRSKLLNDLELDCDEDELVELTLGVASGKITKADAAVFLMAHVKPVS